MISTNRLLVWFCCIAIIGTISFGYLFLIKRHQTSVIVEWSTSSELSTAGFNLYRYDDLNKIPRKVNEFIIPGSTDPLIGGDYQYEDNNVEPGRKYLYELEEVEFNGNSIRYGPIEVTAQRNGIIELIVAITFFILFLIGVVLIMKIQSKKVKISILKVSDLG